MKKRKGFVIIIVLLCTLLLLWFSGLLPKQVAKIIADNYMEKQENSSLYEFNHIEYSPFHDSYFVSYNLKENIEEKRSLEILYKYFPFWGVFTDSNDFTD